MITLLLITSAFAVPTYGVGVGGGVIGGEDAVLGRYSSYSPMATASVDWGFGPVRVGLGVSTSLFMASVDGEEVGAALLQGEAALGLGNDLVSGGVILGAGLSGGEGGLYGRLSFPSDSFASRMGAEMRLFHLGATDTSGMVLLFRMEFAGGDAPEREAPPTVHHDDPYGD